MAEYFYPLMHGEDFWYLLRVRVERYHEHRPPIHIDSEIMRLYNAVMEFRIERKVSDTLVRYYPKYNDPESIDDDPDPDYELYWQFYESAKSELDDSPIFGRGGIFGPNILYDSRPPSDYDNLAMEKYKAAIGFPRKVT